MDLAGHPEACDANFFYDEFEFHSWEINPKPTISIWIDLHMKYWENWVTVEDKDLEDRRS